MALESKNTCQCPICKKHVIPKRCTSFRNTCQPKPDCTCQLTGIQAQFIKSTDRYLGHGESIPFNKVINSHGDAIRYDNAGNFAIKKGNYLVNWNVAVEGCDSSPVVRFALIVGGITHSAATIPITIGMLNGSAFITASEDTSVALVNGTNDIVRLQAVEPMANITIVYVG